MKMLFELKIHADEGKDKNNKNRIKNNKNRLKKFNRKCLKIGHVLVCGYFKQKIATGSLGKMPNG